MGKDHFNVNPSQWVILARIPNEMIFSLRVLLSTRGYATHARPSKLKGTMSLDHFLQRQRTIHFYRKILRGTKAIRDPATKKESRGFARAEFERHRHVTDLSHIRYLLSTGKTEWENMERYIASM